LEGQNGKYKRFINQIIQKSLNPLSHLQEDPAEAAYNYEFRMVN